VLSRKVDKALFEKNQTVQLKDANKPFPSGKGVGVLRWGLKTNEDQLLPFELTCWPEESDDGQFNVNVEYTLKNESLKLKDVDIVIPGLTSAPEVESVDGVYQYNSEKSSLLWHLDQVDSSNTTGTLEFNVSGTDVDSFFPVTLTFSTDQVMCEFVVSSCTTVEDDDAIRFGLSQLMTADIKVG
jgi:hypothetical protein